MSSPDTVPRTLTLSAEGPATLVRTGCAHPSDDLTAELPADEAFGPLVGEHDYRIQIDPNGIGFLDIHFVNRRKDDVGVAHPDDSLSTDSTLDTAPLGEPHQDI